MIRIKHVLPIVLLLICCKFSLAQERWSASRQTVEMQFGAIVYLERYYEGSASGIGTQDTLSGTGFLLSDKGRFYLVTTKNNITQSLVGKEQQRATNRIFISRESTKNYRQGFQLTGLSALPVDKQPFIFSADREGIAIISLQKTAYKKILASLRKGGSKAIPVNAIDRKDDRYPDERFFCTAVMIFKDANGLNKSAGLAPYKITGVDEQLPYFTTDKICYNGNPGGILVADNKVIGILNYNTTKLSNRDIVLDPYDKSRESIGIKASLILPLLRKLQQREQKPDF